MTSYCEQKKLSNKLIGKKNDTHEIDVDILGNQKNRFFANVTVNHVCLPMTINIIEPRQKYRVIYRGTYRPKIFNLSLKKFTSHQGNIFLEIIYFLLEDPLFSELFFEN